MSEYVESNVRPLEEISEILHLAKLKDNDVLPASQNIHFTNENLYANNYKLLQLDNHLMEKISEGCTLFIKGEDRENVVLCTDKLTYDVVETETSNSLLLVNDMKFFNDLKDIKGMQSHKITVSGFFYDYLEAIPTKPYLKQLTDLLNKSIYKGPEHEYEVDTETLLTFEELCKTIQASDNEITSTLDSMVIVEINEKIRLLEFEYHFRVLSYMLKLIDENSWSLDEISYEETINSLKELVPEEILISLFDKYTEESNIIDGLPLYRYKEETVCRFFAQVLLYQAGKFNLEEFFQAWKESVPEGMYPTEEMLNGMALIDRKSHPNVIWAFDEKQLPEDVNARFKQLFEVKEKWSVNEITPYVRSLATEKQDVNALLAKYARASTLSGTKYYSAKHVK